MLLEAPIEPTLQHSEDLVVGLSTTMLGVDTESFVENDTLHNDYIFVPLFFAPLENHVLHILTCVYFDAIVS